MKNYSLIIGLGKTGLSCARYLNQQNVPFAIMDTRTEPPGLTEFKKEFPNVPIYLGGLQAEIILQAKELIVSPGIALQEPQIAKAIAQGIPAIGDIELFVRAIKKPLIAITGTNGKGTVTTLVGNMIRQAGYKVCVGGNIGTPALELLTADEVDFYVLEISSYQLESTQSLRPAAATILNVSADHLDRYGDMASYIAAKQRIYQHAEISVWNRNDDYTAPKNAGTKNTSSFGLSAPQANEFGIRQKDGQFYLAYGDEILLAVDKLKIKGRHNWLNALAALALGQAINLPMAAMLTALQEFKGLTHRCEWVAEKNGVAWYDDSKGTNVGATAAAIESLGSTITGKLILIAGGLGKGADFTSLCKPVAHYVKVVILIGADALLIAEALQNATVIKHAKSLEEAVLLAKDLSVAGDAVLLSPVCASFDMFNNAEHRGEVFKEIVNNLD